MIHQYEATQRLTLIEDDQDSNEQSVPHEAPRQTCIALMTAVMAIVPAAVWASITWFLLGWLAAVVVMVVVVAASVFTIGLLRSAGETETPDATTWHPELQQAA